MDEISFDGRVVLVTGAGSAGYDNLGRAYAHEFARRGAKVAVNDIRPEGCERVVSEITQAGGQAMGIPASIGSPEGAAGVVDAVIDRFGHVDVVINNAGTLRKGPFEELESADLEAVLDVHLRGSIFVAQRAYKEMLRHDYGRIVNISSSAGLYGMRNLTAYAVAKAAVIGLTNVIAIEGAEHGILCNAVLPNADIKRPEGKAITDEEARAGRALFGPLADNGTPEYVAPLIVYLASESCNVSHRIYSAMNGRYASSFIGLTKGWISWDAAPPKAEDIRAHLSEIEDEKGYTIPTDIRDEGEALRTLLRDLGRLPQN